MNFFISKNYFFRPFLHIPDNFKYGLIFLCVNNLCLFEVMRSTLDTIIPTAVTSLCSKPNHITLQVIYCRKRGTTKRCLLSFAKHYGYFLCLVHISLNVGKNSKVRQLIKITQAWFKKDSI